MQRHTGKVLVVGPPGPLLGLLTDGLTEGRWQAEAVAIPGGGDALLHSRPADAVVWLAWSQEGLPVAAEEAEAFLRRLQAADVGAVVVISSAAFYEPNWHHPGLVSEEGGRRERTGNRIAAEWRRLEQQVACRLTDRPERLTLLRPTAVPHCRGRDYFSRLLQGPVAVTLPGHDPTLQLLSPEDLAAAADAVLERSSGGVFNVVPDGGVPLRYALRFCGARRLPVPGWLQRPARRLLAPFGWARAGDQLDYIRYPWTASGERIRRELGFQPRHSSTDALRELSEGMLQLGSRPQQPDRRFDDFGMDRDYIDARGRGIFGFLHDRYWRIEIDCIDHVPGSGRGVLVGVHRGFVPFDAIMVLHALAQRRGRYPRFLIDPGLIKFPFLFNFITRLGGIVACRENAERVLESDEIVGILPEGVRGAFSLYRDGYRLKRFGRDDFVRLALRHRAPILPFVTVGSAEVFPILAKLEWRWWKRHAEWPFLPLTPTFPFLPLPLPSKWHTRFLRPLHVEEDHPPEAADDAAVVRRIGQEVRRRLQENIDWILQRRRSIFYGSVFEG